MSSTPLFFQSPASTKPLLDFLLLPDGETYNAEDIANNDRLATPLNRVLRTAARERANNLDVEHWQAKAIESPVSLRPMVRPVQLSDTVVYELEEARVLINTWGSSPLTGKPLLAQETLLPNRAIQRMSADYVRSHPHAVTDENTPLCSSPLPTYGLEILDLGPAALRRLADLQEASLTRAQRQEQEAQARHMAALLTVCGSAAVMGTMSMTVSTLFISSHTFSARELVCVVLAAGCVGTVFGAVIGAGAVGQFTPLNA